jgi:hypothetical protein
MAITEQELDVRPRTGFRVARWTLRIMLTLEAVLVGLQPISIGQYLDGRYALLDMHAAVAAGAEQVALLLIGVVIWYVLAGGRLWVLVGILLGIAVEAQAAMGYIRDLAVHIPLGVAVVGGTIGFAIWAWTPSSARFRPRSTQPKAVVAAPDYDTEPAAERTDEVVR